MIVNSTKIQSIQYLCFQVTLEGFGADSKVMGIQVPTKQCCFYSIVEKGSQKIWATISIFFEWHYLSPLLNPLFWLSHKIGQKKGLASMYTFRVERCILPYVNEVVRFMHGINLAENYQPQFSLTYGTYIQFPGIFFFSGTSLGVYFFSK